MFQLKMSVSLLLMILVVSSQDMLAGNLSQEITQGETPTSFSSLCTQFTKYSVKKINAQPQMIKNLLWGTVVAGAAAGTACGIYCIYNGIKNRRAVRHEELLSTSQMPERSTALLRQSPSTSSSSSHYSFDGSEAREKIYLGLFYDPTYTGPDQVSLIPGWLSLTEERYVEFQRKHNINATEALQWFAKFAFKYGSVDYLHKHHHNKGIDATIMPMSGLTSEMLINGTLEFLLRRGADSFAPYYKEVDPSKMPANQEDLPPAIYALSADEFDRLSEDKEVNALTLFLHAGLKSLSGDAMFAWIPYLRYITFICNAESDNKVRQTILLLNLIDHVSFIKRMNADAKNAVEDEMESIEKDSITKKNLIFFILSTMSSTYHGIPIDAKN